MVKHVVCFKLNEGESAEKAKEVLLGMEKNVPTVRAIEVGIDQLRSARSYDVMLTVLVDSFDALKEYQQDKYHCEVVKKHMHAVTKTSISMDYEI